MLPPGPSAPEFLQTMRWVRDPVGMFEDCRERYGPTFTLKLSVGAPIVCLTDPADIKELFSAPPDVLHPGEGGRILEPILGSRSVLVLDEDEHLEQRRLMLPAFHGERMAALNGVLEDVVTRAVAAWPRDEPMSLHPRLQHLTLEVILRAVFGIEAGGDGRLERFLTVMTEYLEQSSRPVNMFPGFQRDLGARSPWGRFVRTRAEALRLVHEEIASRRGGAEGGDDVLAMLLAATHGDGSPMGDDEIADELMTLLVAGHETTASQLAWTFERLARLPDVLARVTEAADAGDEAYLTATLQEALRQRPVLLFAQPRSVRKPYRLAGFDYAPDTCALTANVHLIHHDPALYPEPHTFRPERFLEQPPGTFTWVPFGGGRRRCLGMSFAMLEMRIVLQEVLRRTSLQPVGPADGEARMRRHITLSPKHGARVVLRDRARVVAAAA
jgi:cytochrome P450